MMATGQRIVLSLLLALLLAAPPSAPADSERETKAAELARLRERIRALRADLDRDHGRYDTLAAELQKTERRIADVGRSLRDTGKALEAKEQRLRELRTEAGELEGTLGVQRRYLARQIRAAYAVGRQEFVKILLNQENPALVGRVMAYYDYLNRARTERIGDLLETLTSLHRVRNDIEQEAAKLTRLQRQQMEQQQALQAEREKRETILAELEAELRTKDERLAAMVRDAKELEALIQVLSETLADIPATTDRRPFAASRGHLRWPVKGRVALDYGAPRTAGFRSRGVLIAADSGKEVHAVSHGRVAFADWLRGYGMLLIVDHGNGYMSLYGHNQSLFKEAGDWIDSGEVIASVGNSGGQDATGLYFEIRKDGRPVNPSGWLQR